jgi:hypothetical protein
MIRFSTRQRILPLVLFLAATCGLTIFSVSPAKAELATSAEMEQVCQNWLAHITYEKGTWAGSPTPQITGVDELKSGDTLLARCYHISPQGFVLVSALKEMTPVKAYSETSSLDARQAGGFTEMVTESYSQLYGQYVQRFGSLEAEQTGTRPMFGQVHKSEWSELTQTSAEYLTGQQTKRQALDEAGPLLTSSWHQGVPYNNYCPMGDGGRTVVGCVATAAAQIMKFWQWPQAGLGSHSYLWGGDNSCEGSTASATLSATFSDPYDWAHIPDSCDNGCSSVDTAALAELSYEVGVAFDMDYGKCGSGSYVSLAAQVLPKYFKYSNEIAVENRTNYSLAGWFGVIKQEIDAGRPGDYRISKHSIVCDGWRQQGSRYEFHMNYGWGGSYTTWFVLDSLYCYWESGNLCPASGEYIVTHIKPQDKPVLSYDHASIDDVGGDNDGRADAGETVALNAVIRNDGIDIVTATGTLSSSDPFVSISAASVTYGAIPWGGSGAPDAPYQFQVLAGCPDPHVATFFLTLTAAGGYSAVDTLQVFVGNQAGLTETAEAGAGNWSHRSLTSGYVDQWHLETARSHSTTHAWKMGGAGTTAYGDLADGALVTPPFLLPRQATLTFWHWINAETNTSTTAWDGAVVMISSGDGAWTQITPAGGYPYTVVDNAASPFAANTPCYSGSTGWTEASFDLSAYSGVVQIMFRFGSDGATTGEGWYIDDIAVTGIGCCVNLTGNIDGDGDDVTDISDLSALVAYLFEGGAISDCPEENDIDRSGAVDISDLTVLVDYLFSGSSLPTCP